MSHRHVCANKDKGCTAIWECSAPVVDNWDGFPAKLCAAEEAAGTTALECEECRESARCEDCGAIAVLREPHDAKCDIGRTDNPVETLLADMTRTPMLDKLHKALVK